MATKTETTLTAEKIERYNKRLPRYTSYPTAPNWSTDEYTPENYLTHLKKISTDDEPMSLYLHIPFCERRCLFCACNTIITQREERSLRYLKYLKKEIDAVSEIVGDSRDVIQFHIGGGTPTHISPELLDDLFTYFSDHFNFLDTAEKSIEVHPSMTSNDHLDVLVDHKFNRLSMGVQDFDENVQEKLNRHQSYEETAELINYARNVGFESINVDLIYGLPYQTHEGFLSTIDQIFELRPERIAMYSYAHFPKIFRHHQGIPLDVIATGKTKLERFLDARERFLQNDYHQIGFDHFAVEEDELWTSFQDKTLRRNFMGYTTKAGTDLIAIGWSGISELSTSYAQNSKDIKEYENMIDKYGVAIIKGHTMSENDKIRKRLIMNILCQGEINIDKLEDTFDKELPKIREEAETRLPEMEQAGFIERSNNRWNLTTDGQIFARVVAAKFDNYLDRDHQFSTSV